MNSSLASSGGIEILYDATLTLSKNSSGFFTPALSNFPSELQYHILWFEFEWLNLNSSFHVSKLSFEPNQSISNYSYITLIYTAYDNSVPLGPNYAKCLKTVVPCSIGNDYMINNQPSFVYMAIEGSTYYPSMSYIPSQFMGNIYLGCLSNDYTLSSMNIHITFKGFGKMT